MENYVWSRENEINDENTTIGDEVINQHGTHSIVVGKTKNNEFILCFANMETKRPTFYVYDEHESRFSFCIKTGNHYDYIKEMFS